VGSESRFSPKDLRSNNPGTGSQIWRKTARNAEAYTATATLGFSSRQNTIPQALRINDRDNANARF
jgi:hypothetical protein